VPSPAFFRRHHRATTTILVAALALAASLTVGVSAGWVDGFFYDLSLSVHGARPGIDGEPVAVIAVDGASLAADELVSTPRVFFAPFWAKLIDGLASSGVKAIGFDIIFNYSANRFPALRAQYDRDFLDALARHRDRLVLARSAGLALAPPIEAAVYDLDRDAEKDQPAAVAFVELVPDSDGVQRRVTASLPAADGHLLPTLSAALLARAQAPAMPDSVLLAPAVPLEAVPTYRLIDVLRCLDRQPAVLDQAFAGKIVLIGTNLPEEDRRRAPDRFMPPARAAPAAGGACSLGRLGASDPGSGTTPGVFLHAAAVQSVLNGNIISVVPAAGRAAAAFISSICGSLLGFAFAPWIALAGVALLAFASFGLALVMLPFGWWFPVMVPMTAAVTSMVLAYVVRLLVEERRRRRVQEAFGRYLAPSIVDRLTEHEAELRLGGERREVTVMFADLSGFTALSGKVAPEELMELTNGYLALIVDAVEMTGGYVDKFIGDAVMALWGAPLADPDHAASAAQGALRALASVMRAKAEADKRGESGYTVKIGLNTGPAVVGNVGAAKRYNYTAVGETVNVAARLEGVPEDYGCRIVVGPGTAAAIADRFVLCELDWVRVKGKDDAFAVYELIGERSTASPAERAYPARYQVALERYRAGDFAAAQKFWRCLAEHGNHGGAARSPSWVMANRCAELAAAPPARWDGIFVKTTK
jgi:class 3 adenylate cyclase